MIELRFCNEGGRVTGGETPVPDDLCEYQHPNVGALVGCNRLKCSDCGAWVRHGPPGFVAKEDARPHLAEIYEAENWRRLACLKKGPTSHRLYVCRCTAWAGNHDYMMADPDPEYTDPVLPWRCDGHPVPELPVEFDGEVLSSETDFDAFVDRVMDGWCPRPVFKRGEQGPSLWLIWAYAYLLGLPEADAFSRACALRVSDSDPAIAGRVLHLFARFPQAEGVAHVIDRATDHPERIAVGYAVPERWTYSTEIELLAARLAQSKEPKDEIDTSAMNLFRRALLTPRNDLSTETLGSLDVDDYEKKVFDILRADLPSRMLEELRGTSAFGDNDLEWLANHAADIERAGPTRWKVVLSVLSWADRTRKEELAHLVVVAGVTLVKSGLVDLSELRAWISTTGANQAWALPIEIAIDKQQGS